MDIVDFTFIPNHLDVQDCLPFELMPGYTLMNANDIEVEAIDKNLQKMGSILSVTGELPYKLAFEFNHPPEYDHLPDEIIHVSTTKLNRDLWKYYVVKYEDQGLLLSKYQLAANLMDVAIAFDLFQFNIYEGQYSFGYTPDLVFRFFSDNDISKKHDIKLKNLHELKSTYEKMCSIEEHFHGIMNSIYIYNSLRYLQNYSEFKIFGLFTVIESLITHNPSSKETGDSITRQIRTKLPLLFNRIEGGVNYSQQFDDAKEKTIWSKMYSYRSCLAHGKQANFEKDLSILNSPINVHDFLINCIKKLLLLALSEPKLIKDLKEC